MYCLLAGRYTSAFHGGSSRLRSISSSRLSHQAFTRRARSVEYVTAAVSWMQGPFVSAGPDGMHAPQVLGNEDFTSTVPYTVPAYAPIVCT